MDRLKRNHSLSKAIETAKILQKNASKQHSKKKIILRLPFLLCSLSFLLLVSFLLFPSSSTSCDASDNCVEGSDVSLEILKAKQKKLSYTDRNFTLDNVPIRIVSGSVHYFRASPSSWRAILEGAKSMGLNAIETYMPWNLHEPTEGEFVFSGMFDIRSFLEIAHSVGLLVMLRPGPYICSEWDLGGIPAWILNSNNKFELRSVEFLKKAEAYFDAVVDQVRPYVGRPVVALQLENEYGAYGEDKYYMYKIKQMWESRGFKRNNLMLFTSDNGGISSISNGSPFSSDQVLKTINLESDVGRRIDLLRQIQPSAPAMIGEFWTGWFDHWGEVHHTRSVDDVVEQARKALLDYDANLNLYMFFGGTNFGFMNGANLNSKGTYLPTTTSYDYDGFMTEDGRVREEKYIPMRKMLRRFWHAMGNEEMFNATNKPIPIRLLSGFSGPVYLREGRPLLDLLDVASDGVLESRTVLPMEDIGSGYGYVLYSHIIDYSLYNDTSHALSLQLGPVRDFAIIICDGKTAGTVDRNFELSGDGTTYKRTKIPVGTKRIDILVENRGRVNYGKGVLRDRKGLLKDVTLHGIPMEGFKIYSLSFPSHHEMLPLPRNKTVIDRLSAVVRGSYKVPPLKDSTSPPTIFRGTMWIGPDSAEKFSEGTLPGTYVRAFGRGVIWINGFNVGRFHTGVSGPQRSLFVPGSILREGLNEVLALHQNLFLVRGNPYPLVQFFAQSDYGHEVHVYDSRISAI